MSDPTPAELAEMHAVRRARWCLKPLLERPVSPDQREACDRVTDEIVQLQNRIGLLRSTLQAIANITDSELKKDRPDPLLNELLHLLGCNAKRALNEGKR
jgi:hypothetical protein